MGKPLTVTCREARTDRNRGDRTEKTYIYTAIDTHMDFKTAVLIAFGLAFVLPYVTVALMKIGGSTGPFLVGGLFVGVIFLLIWGEFNNDEDAAMPENADSPALEHDTER